MQLQRRASVQPVLNYFTYYVGKILATCHTALWLSVTIKYSYFLCQWSDAWAQLQASSVSVCRKSKTDGARITNYGRELGSLGLLLFWA